MKVFLLVVGFVFLLFVAVGLTGGQVLPLGSIPIGTPVTGLTVDSQMPGGAGVTTTTSPWTWSFTNTAGTALYLFVTIDGALTTPTASYNAVAMTFLGNRFTGNAGALYLFQLEGAPTGAHNFVITWPTGTQTAIAAAISFRNDNGALFPTVNACNLNNPAPGSTCVTASNFPVSASGTRTGNIMLQAACYGDAGHSTQSGTLSALLEVNGASFCNNMELQFQSATNGTTAMAFANTVVTSYATLGVAVLGNTDPLTPIQPLSLLPNTCSNTLGGTVASSVSCTWNTSPFAGSNLICSGSTWNTGSTVTNLSISDGTAFTSSMAGGSNAFQYATNKWIFVGFRFNIGSNAPATVTMTISGTDGNADLVCSAFQDNVGSTAVDGTCTGNTNTTTATLSCGTPITTTGTDFVYGHIAAGGTFPTITSGWQLGSFERGSTSANLVQGVASSVNPLFNTPTAGQQAGVIGLAIKP